MGTNQCKKCGEWYSGIHDCKQDFFSMYNYAKLHGIDLDNQPKTNFKINDIIMLKSDSLTKNGFDKDKYKEIYTNNIKGKIIKLWEAKNHYLWGEYASVEWDNNYTSNTIHVSYLSK